MQGSSLSRRLRPRRAAAWVLLLPVLALGAALPPAAAREASPPAATPAPAATGLAVPPCDDPAWRSPEVAAALAPVLRRATAQLAAAVPPWDEKAYTEFSRIGRREAGERMLMARQVPVGVWTLAECHEGQGRFLAPLAALLEDVARQPSWTLPAHDKDLGNLAGRHTVDLNVCEFGHDLAWALRLLGPRLPAATRQGVQQALESRMFRPLREAMVTRSQGGPLKAHWWLDSPTNWNAVCVGGVTGAALTLGHPDGDVWKVLAPDLVRSYLKSVLADGYSDEGPGYWNYGFGQYLRLRETLRAAGGPDIATDPVALALARYPARIAMGGGLAALFGDARPGSGPHPVVQAHADAVLGRSDAAAYRRVARAQVAGTRLNEAIWRLWGLPQPAAREAAAGHEACTLFADSGVAVFRPTTAAATDGDGLSVSLRLGGSRAHAHDDAGSWAVTVGPRYLAGDVGAPTYTADTFGPRRRENRLVNSWGHPLPVVDGVLQQDATRVRAAWLQAPCRGGDPGVERAHIDLRPVYALDGLQRLERRFAYRREGAGALAISDHLASLTARRLESAFVSHAEPVMQPHGFVLRQDGRALHVTVAASGPFELVHERVTSDPGNAFSRVVVRLAQPAREACIAWTLTAGDAPAAGATPPASGTPCS